jgi:hypothetical protein
MIEKLTSFNEILEKDSQIAAVTKIGFCRLWTRRAAELARDYFESNKWEVIARETIAKSSESHTFLRIRSLNDEQLSFFYDGVGTCRFGPYCGPENESPPHLKENRRDYFCQYF